MVAQERPQEVAHGVGAKVGRDVADPQGAFEIRVDRVRPLVHAQRLGVLPRPGPRLVAQVGGVVARVGERDQDQVAVRVVVRRVELDGAPVAGDGARTIPALEERVRQVMMGRREARGERDGALAVRDRLAHLLEGQQRPGQADVKLGAVGTELQRALQLGERPRRVAGVHEREPQVVVRLGEIGVRGEGAFAGGERGVQPAVPPVGLGQVREIRGVRRDLDQTFQIPARLLEPPGLEQQPAQHEQRAILARLARQHLAVGGLGLLAPAGPLMLQRAVQQLADRSLWLHRGAPETLPWATCVFKTTATFEKTPRPKKWYANGPA